MNCCGAALVMMMMMSEEQRVLHDADMREPLFDYLEETRGKIRIVEEKQMGKSRADVVMVAGDSLTGIEIKSDADTYTRLARQVKDYNRFFDYNLIVVGSTHAMHVAEHVPDWWGIISAEVIKGSFDFYEVRICLPNPKPDLKRKLGFLWRPELAHIQELNGMHKYRERSKDFVISKILESAAPETLHRQISEELFERDYTTIEEELNAYRRQRARR